ncbi:MAG: hypothetical protein WBA99_14540, partial [Nodosilinea sp.]
MALRLLSGASYSSLLSSFKAAELRSRKTLNQKINFIPIRFLGRGNITIVKTMTDFNCAVQFGLASF